jgi:ABC-type Na+ transport system ATPase subunit NatA
VLVLEYMEGTRIDRLHERLASGELRLDALMTILVELYLKMMLEDGVFHADPHAGNLLVDPAGRIVLLDFGMVLEVERETRRRLVQTVLAAARQDVDGVINGFYELGILDPDVDRGTVRDAAQSLMAIGVRDDVSPRQIQRLVEQVLHTFYEWPLMLPSNLVYFGRAAVLVEGIGLRYDPEFNGIAIARPVLARSAARLVQGVLQEDPRARISDWTQEALTALRTVRELVRRVERDELRVRWHPRDTLELLAHVYEIPRGVWRARLRELTEAFDLGPLLDRPVRQLSLGERMRCEIAASLLHAPRVLFLDEPTIGLDVTAKATIRELLHRRSSEDGTTLLLTSHDTGDIEEVCDRVVIIHRGRILLDASVAEMKRRYPSARRLTVEDQPLDEIIRSIYRTADLAAEGTA